MKTKNTKALAVVVLWAVLVWLVSCCSAVRQSETWQVKRIAKHQETKNQRAERIVFTTVVALGVFLPAYGPRIKF